MTEKVRINIGGVKFETHADTLETFPGTVLAELHHKSCYYDDKAGEYFFDRNPHVFSFILEAYRTGELHIPKGICGRTIQREMEFWGLSPGLVSECCWKGFYKTEMDLNIIASLTKTYYTSTNMCHLMSGNTNTAKMKVWLFLDEPRSSKQAQAWSIFMMSVVFLSTICSALQTLPLFRQYFPEHKRESAINILSSLGYNNNTDVNDVIGLRHPSIYFIDIVCFIFITMETILRLVTCPRLCSFFHSFINLSDLVSVCSFWACKGLESKFYYLESTRLFILFIIFESLVILKIIRFCRLYRQIPALNVLALSIKSNKSEIGVLAVILLILINLFGYLMFCAEFVTNSDFQNAFLSMYWAVITLTTVGYGDYQPSTPQGHVIAAACAMCGVLMLALPIGVIAASFNTLYSHHKYAMKHIQKHKLTSAAGNVCKVDFKHRRRRPVKGKSTNKQMMNGTNTKYPTAPQPNNKTSEQNKHQQQQQQQQQSQQQQQQSQQQQSQQQQAQQ